MTIPEATVLALRAWAASMPSDARIGVAASVYGCPIACYLRTLVPVYLTTSTKLVTVQNDGAWHHRELTATEAAIVAAVDRVPPGEPLTAARFLTILDELETPNP